jgi:hypothetical protein
MWTNVCYIHLFVCHAWNLSIDQAHVSLPSSSSTIPVGAAAAAAVHERWCQQQAC